ncbi:MAG: DUF4347 domain-containing protein [Cellvibrio sp.]|uniref:DUF4347 domain-containing protein n=1 Tax=Cellvibrio sp. TaxID=1965322 RepID=UPI0031B07FD8
MKNLLFSGLSSLLLPLGAYATSTTGTSYQRTYLSSSINASAADLSHASALPRDLVDLSGDQLDIQIAHSVRELVIVDEGVAEADKSVLRRALKPGVEMVHISSTEAGLPQLISALEGHKNLAAIHIVSHAEAGAILLGNSRITAENIQQEVHAFAALTGAVREGGDLLFYGCELAANKAGEDLLDIISNNTGLDVAASNNLTGNPALNGDWDLEVKRGNVETALAFSEKSLKDFSSVLVASSGTKTFQTGWVDNNSNLTHTDFILTAKDSGGSAISNVSIYSSAPFPAYVQTGYNTSTTGTYFYVAADGVDTGSFELTGLVAGEASGLGGQFTNVQVIGIKPDNSTITSSTITGSGTPDETFTFAAGQLAGFSGVKLKAFKLVFDTTSGSATKPFFEFRSFTITGALAPLPVVTDGRISTSGASGTGGAYKIGDTVTATWNNTAGGDNNTGITGVTVDFSQFGGGAAVVASNSSNTWTATYTIISGAIDNTSRNVSVTATNAGGNTTTADTTNATVDNIAPTVTDGRISISGASGTSGAYKIGDTVTATWNNTAGGDNNSDTISSVTVNFTQFGGGAAVSATNSSGTWTATYTIVAGAIDNTNRNVTVTATDNAGNATSTSDTTNATVDNIAPSVSSITPAGGAVSSDTTVDFIVDFSESVSNVSTDDFTRVVTSSAAGTIASVSASSGDPITVTVGAISGSGTLKVNLNGSTNIVDDAGNSIAAYSSGTTHTVNILTAPDAPTVGAATAGDGQVSVAFTAPASNGGSAITGYTVTSNPGGITGGGNGFTTSPITVSGLTNGTTYTFTVTATNAIGTSTASGASGSATPKADQTITFANPGSQNFGTTPPLNGTSTSGLTVTFSSSTTGVCTVSGTTLTFVTAGSCTIDADQAGNASTNAAPTVSRTFTVNAVVPGAPTTVTATAGDTQADVAFTAPASNGGATITGYTVTSNPGGFTGTGAGSPITVTGLTNGVSYTFTVTATNSAGTGSASGASNSITPASPQIITFANPGAQSFGTSPDLGVGVSSTSGLTVAFTSSTTGVCTVTGGGVLTFVSTGTCTINANQAGDSTYLPAPQVTRSFTVNPANQTITFTNPGAQNFGGSPTLSGSSTSGLAVTFSSSTTGVCTITSGGVLTFVTAGTCTIDADQAGDATTNAAMTVSRTFTVNAIVPGAPTIGTATAGDTQADVAFTAPASNGGATITGYTVTSNPGGFTGTGAGSPITVTGLTNGVSYTFTVTATNVAGTGGASGVSNSITPASPQVITFANPGTQSFGTAPDLSILGGGASSTSGLTVAFTSSTTGVCTITSGGILTFVTAGTCTINANQAGNTQYLPAPQVSRSFTVSPIVPNAPTIGTAVAGDTQVSVAFTAPVNTGGTTITGYTVTVSPADVAPVNGASSPIVVTGLTNGQAYTFTVTADNSAGTGPASSASNSVIPKSTQTITFINPGPQNFGATPTLSANSDSGLSPTFTSSTTGVCTITSVGVVTFVTAGTCTINADQPGNGSYLAATQVTRSFAVNAVLPGVPTIGTATAGNAQATVTFTAPTSNGGAAITSYTVTANPGGITRTATASPYTFTGLTNGTSYTFAVAATNSVGTGGVSGASNAVTPALPLNSAPVITQGSATNVTMSEDGSPTPFALTLTATDGDSDPLTWSISSAAQHGSASVLSGAVSYTPTANYNGSDSFVVRVSDGTANANITVNVTITAVNDAPIITGTPSTNVNQDVAYSFTPTASDVDVADALTFSITNKPSWASFNTTTGALTGTPANADAGVHGAIVISVSDGTVSTALPAFDIEVISTLDPLQPVVTAPANLDINATALFTPVTLRQLLGLNSSASEGDVDQAVKLIAKDGVSGNDCCTTTAQGLTASNALLLAPGRHELKWTAINAAGITGEGAQIVNIAPLVSLSKSQIAVRDSDVEFRVLLNGPSPVYPLSIPYAIDATSTATVAEHNLVDGTAIFTQPGQVEVVVPVKLNAVTGFSDSQLVVALGAGINAGVANRHVIDIRSGNVPPVVNLVVSQGGVDTSLVTPGGGAVTLTASVTDANKTDTHTFQWIGTGLIGDAASASRTIDPSGLSGSYQIQVIVTDSGGAIVQTSAYFRVVNTLPVLDENTDTDQDGISDAAEGTSDSDDNGIPDYLDNMPSSNILPQQGNTTNAYLIECDPGVRCGLGLFARGGNSGGVQILDEEIGSLNSLVADPAFEPVGGIFDFAIRDLPTPGQSVRVVIPQRSAIPANAVYRKFQNGSWVNFVSNANNALHSAAGNAGYCPPPGTSDWTSGLTQGHLCVQLTIEDGGPNDDDGQVNSAVVDPGAVSEAKEVEPPEPPEPPKPPVEVKSKGGGAMGGIWLLLLGGLMMMKRLKPIWFVVIALVATAANVQAKDDKGFYLRADISNVVSSQEEEDFVSGVSAAGHEFAINRYDENRAGYHLALGHQWDSNHYTELGYLDLGDVTVDVTLAGGTDLDEFARDFAANYPLSAEGLTLVQGVVLTPNSLFKVSAEVGVFVWRSEIGVASNVFSVDKEKGNDPLVGFKFELPLTDRIGLGLGLRRIYFEEQEADLFSFTSSFHF